MKKISYLLTLAIFSVSLAVPAAAELTPDEQKVVDLCKANIENKTFSPKEADRCIKALPPDGPLYKKLKEEDQDTLNYIIKYDGVLVELGQFFRDKPEECLIRERMMDLLEVSNYQEACVLCDKEMDMAPQPEKLVPWIGKNYNESLFPSQKASLAWNVSGAPRAKMLGNMGVTQARWAQLRIPERTAVVMNEALLSNQETFPDDVVKCRIFGSDAQGFMNRNLPADIRTAMFAYLKKIMPAAGADGKGPTGPDGSKFAAANSKIKGMGGSDGDVMNYLGGLFDKKAAASGIAPNPAGAPAAGAAGNKPGVKPPADKYELPVDKLPLVAAELKTRMLGGTSTLDGKERKPAFSGTPWEDEALKFYTAKDDKGNLKHDMNFQVLTLGKYTNGGYCPQHAAGGCNDDDNFPGQSFPPGSIGVNKTLIEAWMKKNNVTSEQLTKSPELMDRLGRHLYVVMVHEGPVHEVRQDQFYIANGVPNKKILDKEAMAFGLSTLSLKNKFNGPEGALYRREASDFDLKTLKAVEDGGFRGIKQFVRYYDLEGAQGVGSKTIKQLESGLKEMELRKTDPGYAAQPRNTAECSWYDIANCSDAQLTSMTQKAYPWYEVVIKRQKEETEMLNRVLAEQIKSGPGFFNFIKTKKVDKLKDYNEEEL